MTNSFVDQHKQSQKNNYASRKVSTKALLHSPLSTLYTDVNKELTCHVNCLVTMPCQLESKVRPLDLFTIYCSSPSASERGYVSNGNKSALALLVSSPESLHEEPCSDCLGWKYIFS